MEERYEGQKVFVHVVREGETLYQIARKYDVKVYEIMKLNPYIELYDLKADEEVLIPTCL